MTKPAVGNQHLGRPNDSRFMAEAPVRFLGGIVIRGETWCGAYTEFGRNIEIQLATLGRYCEMGPGSHLGATGHPTTWLSVSAFQYKQQTWGWHPTADQVELIDPEADGRVSFRGDGPAKIGNDVWLGANVVVLRGVTIGDGCIVAAGAVVTKDLPPYSIAGGIPARVIKPRMDPGLAAELRDLAWWRFTPNQLSGIQFDDPALAARQLHERIPDLEPYEPGFVEIRKPEEPARKRLFFRR